MLALWLAASLCASDIEAESELYKATVATRAYAAELSRAAPPSLTPTPVAALDRASVWLQIPLERLRERQLDGYRTIGFDAVNFGPLAPEQEAPLLALMPQLMRRGLGVIGTLTPAVNSRDVHLALRNMGDYPTLFRLIEVCTPDWNLLPPVPTDLQSANIPFPLLLELQKRGYLADPTRRFPSAIQTTWQATRAVTGADGVTRRWIYEAVDPSGTPALDWLSPTFAPERLGSGQLLDQVFRIGCAGLRLTGLGGALPFSQLLRQTGAFSLLDLPLSLDAIPGAPADLLLDTLTPDPLVSLNVEGLRTAYRMLLQRGLQPLRFLHRVPIATGGVRPVAESPDEEITYDILARSSRPLLPSAIAPEALPQVARLFTLFYAAQGGAVEIPHALLPKNLNHAEWLRRILQVRSEHRLDLAELMELPPSPQLFLALHKLKSGRLLLAAYNLSPQPAQELVAHPALLTAHAIDLLEGLEVPKSYRLGELPVSLDAYSGKLYLLFPNP